MGDSKMNEIKAMFEKYDRNHDGLISRDELTDVLTAIGCGEDVDAMFQKIDLNHDGKIEYSEFLAWLYDDKEEIARVEDIFAAFCDNKPDMDGRGFVKLCKDCKLMGSGMSPIEADLIFAKVAKGSRRIGFAQFEQALEQIATKKGSTVQDIHATLGKGSGPVLRGTKAEAVRFHDDPSTYTGMHALNSPEPSRGAPPAERRAPAPAAHAHASKAPAAAQAPKAAMGTVESTFKSYCGSSKDLDGKSCAKLCKDCGLYDSKFSATHVDLTFAKVVVKGKRRLELPQFEKFLDEVAAKKGVSGEDVRRKVAASGGPVLHGTQAEAVRFADPSNFTGTHVHGGPEAGALGGGTSTQLAAHGMRSGH